MEYQREDSCPPRVCIHLKRRCAASPLDVHVTCQCCLTLHACRAWAVGAFKDSPLTNTLMWWLLAPCLFLTSQIKVVLTASSTFLIDSLSFSTTTESGKGPDALERKKEGDLSEKRRMKHPDYIWKNVFFSKTTLKWGTYNGYGKYILNVLLFVYLQPFA